MATTSILLLASMHNFHQDHPHYDYDKLFQVVAKIKPDYVGVEIRPEDLGTDEAYLSRNYPYEMVELAKRYSENSFGFDWLDDDIAGKPIPDNYWKELSKIKKLERQVVDDSNFQDALQVDELLEQQMEILKTATPASLIDGRYGEVTKKYYEALDNLLRGTQYELISIHRAKRDRMIGAHIVDFIRGHAGKRIALVMGANHHIFAKETLVKEFNDGELIYFQPDQ